MIESLLSLAFVAQVLRIAVPYALAALGGVVSERGGVIALALEGMLLSGGFCAVLGAHASGSAGVGAVTGVAGGLAVGGLYAVASIRFRADQIVAGVAINLLALGLTRYLLKLVFDSTANSPPVAGLARPIAAEPLLWLALALVPGVHVLMARTSFGLRLRAAGDHPEAAETAGVRVGALRYRAVLLSGALAGLGGAWLALGSEGFTADMSGGRGYIALAAVIMGKWRPVPAALACLLFALAEAVQLNLQATTGLAVPRELIQILPYALTIVALAGFIGRSNPPRALGK